MHASESYGSRLRAACKDLAPLVAQADEAFQALPTVAHWVKRRDRAAQRLSGPHFDPGARLTFDSLNRQIDEFYARFAALCKRIGQTAETLQGVLPRHEVEQLLARLDPSEVEATYRAVQQLSVRLEEFRASCDDAETLETTQTAESKSQPKRKHGPAADMAKHRLIREIVEGRDGDGWRRDQVQLRELAAEMDQQEVWGSSAWSRWDSRPTTWSEAARQDHERVIKSIDHSLKQAQARYAE